MARPPRRRPALAAALLLVGALAGPPALCAQEESPSIRPITPRPAAGNCPAPALRGPVVTAGHAPPLLPAVPPEASDKPLPINLATALRLAGARPVVIAAAQAGVQVAAAELERARVAWLPNLNLGAGYYHHDGATQ